MSLWKKPKGRIWSRFIGGNILSLLIIRVSCVIKQASLKGGGGNGGVRKTNSEVTYERVFDGVLYEYVRTPGDVFSKFLSTV